GRAGAPRFAGCRTEASRRDAGEDGGSPREGPDGAGDDPHEVRALRTGEGAETPEGARDGAQPGAGRLQCAAETRGPRAPGGARPAAAGPAERAAAESTAAQRAGAETGGREAVCDCARSGATAAT